MQRLRPLGFYSRLLYDNLEYYAMEYTLIAMPRVIYQEEHKKITEKLKTAREEAGLDQTDVAKKLGKTQSYVSKIESGQRRFDVLQLKEFARIYKKDLSWFLQ